jgi:hypothetical protein
MSTLRSGLLTGILLSLLVAVPAGAQATSEFAGAVPMEPYPPMPDLTSEQLAKVRAMRIFFGHQSVGKNLLDGASAIMSRNGVSFPIVQSDDPRALQSPAWAHTELGQNGAPETKISQFRALMDKGFGERADAAFFKFCYIDFDSNSDVEKIFAQYHAAMTELKRKYPKVTFIHVTTPLTTVGMGIGSSVRRMFGMRVWGEEENIRRTRFNELLHRAYDSNEPVFDLALLEATTPGGEIQAFRKHGLHFPSLVPEYTADGGHLNLAASTKIAQELLRLLSSLPLKMARADQADAP